MAESGVVTASIVIPYITLSFKDVALANFWDYS
jgi:hypothetical protein